MLPGTLCPAVTEAFQPDWSPNDESEDDEPPPECLQPKPEITVLKISLGEQVAEESKEENPESATNKISQEAMPDSVQTDPTAAVSSTSSSARLAETADGGLQGPADEKAPGWLSWLGTRKQVSGLQAGIQKGIKNKQPFTAKKETLPTVKVQTLPDGNVRTVQ